MLEGFGLRKASGEAYYKHCNDMETNHKLSDSKANNYFHQKRRLLVRILVFGVAITLLHFVYVIAQEGACGGRSNCFMYAAQGLNPFGNGAAALEPSSPRHAFKSQEEYIQLKLNKTVNPELLRLWTTKEWRRNVEAFSVLFQGLIAEGLLSTESKVLCLGAKDGQEVLALKEIGVSDAVGFDPVASPPLVMEGDMHRQPSEDNTFDFEFSSVFDPSVDFASEIERTLKPGGVAVVRFKSSGDMYSIDSFIHFFNNCNIVRFTEKDEGYLEIVLKKSVNKNTEQGAAKCSVPAWNKAAIDQAETLIEEEPLKPWITLKRNVKNIKYLPSMADIGNRRKYVYVDVGARSYGSSIGSWFKKRYPKQNNKFDVYAIEADRAFYGDYEKRKGVKLLPYAAWVRNETLSFEINKDAGSSVESNGMGRIQPKSSAAIINGSEKDVSVVTVQGFDFAEWLKRTVSRHDFVVMKMDVEGAEFDLLPRMFETGAICLIDELFLECHYNRWQRCCPERSPKYQRTYGECLNLFNSLRNNGVLVHQWW